MPCFCRKTTFGKNWAESWDLEVNSPEDVSADHPTPNRLKATKFLYFTFITECIYNYLKKIHELFCKHELRFTDNLEAVDLAPMDPMSLGSERRAMFVYYFRKESITTN